MWAQRCCGLLPEHGFSQWLRSACRCSAVTRTEKTQMHMDEKVIPITRGKPSRPQLSITSSATRIDVQLQRIPTRPAGAAASPRSLSPSQAPATVLEFEPRLQKGNMKVNRYEISDDNHVCAVDGTETGTAVFASEQELEQLIAGWPARRLVEVWNQLPGVRPVARFENRSVAVRRIWQALQEPRSAPADGGETKRKRHRRESKLEIVLRMLRSSEGASLAVLMKVTRWQAHSVRGFLSSKVSKQLQLPLESFRRDGERVYRLPVQQ